MTNPFKNSLLRLLLPACAATLAGCATTQMSAQWKDPAFTGASLRGNRTLVLCQARDYVLRRICEDQWASQLGAQGMIALRGYTLSDFPPDGTANPDEIRAAARASDAVAVASTQLAPSDYALVNPGPQVGVGVGGGSGGAYRGGGFSFGGLGFSFPLGGASTTQGMGSSTSLVDVASGALIWSGRATTSASSDLTAQISALTRVTIEAMSKAGLIPPPAQIQR